jgi:hypothetical protein
MVSRFLPVLLMAFPIGFLAETANAQGLVSGTAAAPPPAGQASQLNKPMAQSNSQMYQAPPCPTYSGYYGSPYNYGGSYYGNSSDWRRWDNDRYHGIAPSGNFGYYGSPYNYGGSYYGDSSDWRRWDNDRYHGIAPSGNVGYYGSPYNYGGSYNGYSSDWRRWDNAKDHGVNPNAYP